MKFLRYLIPIIVAAIVSWPAVAQRTRLFTSESQLSSALINKIMKDSHGFVWVATENGLNRFDGSRFKVYYKERGNPRSLPGNYIHTVFETSDGDILVGCINGLALYDPHSDSFDEIKLLINNSETAAHVVDILETSNGDIWIGTAGCGVFAYDRNTKTATYLESLMKLIGSSMISVLFEDSAHAIWIGTESHGVCRYYPTSNLARNYFAPELSGNTVTTLNETSDGTILIGTLEGGMDRYKRKEEVFERVPSPQGLFVAVKTIVNIDGHMLVGTDGQGILEYSRGALNAAGLDFDSPGIETPMKVHQIVSDQEGNIMLGVYQRGLVFMPFHSLNFHYAGNRQGPLNPIGHGCVMAVYADNANSVWVGCDDGCGIYNIDKNGNRIAAYALEPTALCFMRTRDGRLWTGTYHAGAFILSGNGIWQPVKGLSDRKIYSLCEYTNGNIYVGSLDRGLEIYNPDSGRIISCMDKPGIERAGNTENVVNSVNALLLSHDNKIWVAHYNGISCYDPERDNFMRFNDVVDLVARCVGYSLHEDASGRIWAGTSDGLYCYNPSDASLRHYTAADGLPAEIVGGICEDKRGNIWASTYHGIAMIPFDGGGITTYDYGDGLQGNEFTHGAYFTDEQGTIYFGGLNGLTYFHPLDIENRGHSARPLITEVGVFNSRGPKGASYEVITADCSENVKVKVKHDDNTLRIYFSTLSFENPDKIRFEYRIREQGNKWLHNEPGQNFVTLYNLSPGRYTFDVRAEGQPDRTASVRITVQSPWYTSWWAILIYTAAALALLSLFVHSRRQHTKAQEELARRRHAEEVAEAKLQLFTSFSHEIRTPMTLIIDPLRKLIEDCKDSSLLPSYLIIYRNASRILALVNQLMDLRKIDKGQMKLRARETDMVGFIEDVMKPFEGYAREHGITLSFHHTMDRLPCWIDLEHFDKVMMNLLSNAFKHTPREGRIDVILNAPVENADGTSELAITVRDTGEGIPPQSIDRIFDRFFQADNENSKYGPGTGIGLNLVRQIVALHHGSVTAANREDTAGAEFKVRIPLGNAHLSDDEMMNGKPDEKAPTPSSDDEPFGINVPETTEIQPAHGRENSTIIVVEDDDENRNYVARRLREHYRNVITFSNADEAFRAVLYLSPMPDIIISDIMMPGMDGITFTRKLKQNANTNHIPVILLSARSEQAEIKEAIESGADQYVLKPFDSELLLSIVGNILSNRHRLQVKFSGSQEQEDKVENISLKSADEQLMQKIMECINKNIASPDFSVEKLASAAGLSRAHLHRKLKELTNLSARDFIRNIRMRQAARLLVESKLSVAEVAYAVGFSTASHFSLIFRDFYGQTPTQYIASQRSQPQQDANG